MKDHIVWRPNWYRSEFHDLREYDRGQRRHAFAAFLGLLTAVACSAGIIYLVS